MKFQKTLSFFIAVLIALTPIAYASHTLLGFAAVSNPQPFHFVKTSVIQKEADFPPVNGSNQHVLEAGVNYRIDGEVSASNNFLMPTSGFVGINGNGVSDKLTYTGGGTMFVQPAHTGGSILLHTVTLDGNSTATWWDITEVSGSLEVVWTTVNINNFADLGDLDVSSIAGNFTTHGDYAAPLDATVGSDFFMQGSIFFSSSGTSDAIILRMGVDSIAQVLGNTPFVATGESFLNIPSTANDFRMSVSGGNLVAPGGGDLFDPSGLDQTDKRIDAKGNTGFQDSETIGSFVWAENATQTVIADQGTDSTIASIADAGGGNITITTGAAHGLSSGVDVSLSENSGYDGYYTIANASGSVFDVPATFVATGTGRVTSGWVKLAGTTISATNERASMTGNNELTFVNLADHSGLVTASLTVERGTGSASPTMAFVIFKNRTPFLIGGNEVVSKADTTTGIPRPVPIFVPDVIGTGDIYELYGRNLTNTSNILVTDGQVIVD